MEHNFEICPFLNISTLWFEILTDVTENYMKTWNEDVKYEDLMFIENAKRFKLTVLKLTVRSESLVQS